MPSLPATSVLACAATCLFAAAAHAESFVVVDVTYTHSATTTKDSHYNLKPSAATPANWRMPIDYASGTLHHHVEVFTRPSAAAALWNFCFSGTPSYACAGTPTYTKTGVYEWSQPFSSFYQYDKVDWSKMITGVSLILKDAKGTKVAPENVGTAYASMFMPTTVRIVLTVVSPGGKYVPPGDAGMPPDAAPARDAGAPDRAAPRDGPADADDASAAADVGGPVTVGSVGTSGLPEPPTGGAGGSRGGRAGSDEQPPPLGQGRASGVKSGCAAAPGAPRGGIAVFLVLALAVGIQRKFNVVSSQRPAPAASDMISLSASARE